MCFLNSCGHLGRMTCAWPFRLGKYDVNISKSTDTIWPDSGAISWAPILGFLAFPRFSEGQSLEFLGRTSNNVWVKSELRPLEPDLKCQEDAVT